REWGVSLRGAWFPGKRPARSAPRLDREVQAHLRAVLRDPVSVDARRRVQHLQPVDAPDGLGGLLEGLPRGVSPALVGDTFELDGVDDGHAILLSSAIRLRRIASAGGCSSLTRSAALRGAAAPRTPGSP